MLPHQNCSSSHPPAIGPSAIPTRRRPPTPRSQPPALAGR
jgi:hypothetical protein